MISSKRVVWLLVAGAIVAALLLWRADDSPSSTTAPAPVTAAPAAPSGTSPAPAPLPVLPAVASAPAEEPAPVAVDPPAPPAPPLPLAPGVEPIQDQKTIDFSSGKAVVKEDEAEKAAIEAALKEIEEAVKGVTFGPNSGPAELKN
jgi:pyruvate/2-oxoglutarate dehydrogenase complex dihydrolipoamide acyltransferase (E2) component